MDFHCRIAWRALLATATVGLAAAGFGGACAAQDAHGATPQGGYQGPYLGWTGKVGPAPAPEPEPAPEAAPAPVPQADDAPPPVAHSELFPGDAPSQGEAPPQFARSEAPASDAPPAAEAYRAPVAYTPPPTRAPAPAPPPAAEPPPAAPPTAYHQAANTPPQSAGGASGVHFYSVGRQYGMTPDPIPPPGEGHTVLIGPSASAADDAGQADESQSDQDQTNQDQGGVGEDAKAPAHGQAHHGDQSGEH
jgi:hypothetical protein